MPSSVGRHGGWFPFHATVNREAVIVDRQVSLWSVMDSFRYRCMPRSGILRLYIVILLFCKTPTVILIVDTPIYTATVNKDSSLHTAFPASDSSETYLKHPIAKGAGHV